MIIINQLGTIQQEERQDNIDKTWSNEKITAVIISLVFSFTARTC